MQFIFLTLILLLASCRLPESYIYYTEYLPEQHPPDSNPVTDIKIPETKTPVTSSKESLPAAPTNLINYYPARSIGLVKRPIIQVLGVKSGDTVDLYRDSACLNHIGTSSANSGSVLITTIPLEAGMHSFHAQVIDSKNNRSDCSLSGVQYELKSCPLGYVLVEGNSMYNTIAFCVMKYEAKAFHVETATLSPNGCAETGCSTAHWAEIYDPHLMPSGYLPVSTNDNGPWRRISQNRSRQACQALGEGYTLISNNQWMTIAYEIENIGENWSSGIIGDGALNRGHSDNSPNYVCNSLLENVHGDCSTTGTSFSQKRTHILNSNEIIWDFSGNAHSWVDWNIPVESKAYLASTTGPTSSWISIPSLRENGLNTSLGDPMSLHIWAPAHLLWTTAHNIGQYYAGSSTTAGGAVRRGGSHFDGSATGIYALRIDLHSGSTTQHTGFRCTYIP
jgi:hypothetical protein